MPLQQGTSRSQTLHTLTGQVHFALLNRYALAPAECSPAGYGGPPRLPAFPRQLQDLAPQPDLPHEHYPGLPARPNLGGQPQDMYCSAQIGHLFQTPHGNPGGLRPAADMSRLLPYRFEGDSSHWWGGSSFELFGEGSGPEQRQGTGSAGLDETAQRWLAARDLHAQPKAYPSLGQVGTAQIGLAPL